jgi:hypothetical protein
MVILANAFFGSFPKALEVKWKANLYIKKEKEKKKWKANSDSCCRFLWFFKSLM